LIVFLNTFEIKEEKEKNRLEGRNRFCLQIILVHYIDVIDGVQYNVFLILFSLQENGVF